MTSLANNDSSISDSHDISRGPCDSSVASTENSASTNTQIDTENQNTEPVDNNITNDKKDSAPAKPAWFTNGVSFADLLKKSDSASNNATIKSKTGVPIMSLPASVPLSGAQSAVSVGATSASSAHSNASAQHNQNGQNNGSASASRGASQNYAQLSGDSRQQQQHYRYKKQHNNQQQQAPSPVHSLRDGGAYWTPSSPYASDNDRTPNMKYRSSAPSLPDSPSSVAAEKNDLPSPAMSEIFEDQQSGDVKQSTNQNNGSSWQGRQSDSMVDHLAASANAKLSLESNNGEVQGHEYSSENGNVHQGGNDDAYDGYDQRRNYNRSNYRGGYGGPRPPRRGGYGGMAGGMHSPRYYPRNIGYAYPVVDADTLKFYLLGQIEYYFSTDNLCRDIWFRGHMDENGWIPLSLIAGFNRVKALSTDVRFIKEAISHSLVLEMNEESVRKKVDWSKWVLPKDRPSQPQQTVDVEANSH